MKKIILILVFAVATANAQEIHLNDTIKTIITKFETNKSQYIGQPFQKVIEDYGMQVKWAFPGFDYYGSRIDIPKNIKDITLYYINSLDQEKYNQQKKPYIALIITFKPPYTIGKNQFYNDTDDKGDHYEALYLKDLIVDSISLLKYNFGEPKPVKREAAPQPKQYDEHGNEVMFIRFQD